MNSQNGKGNSQLTLCQRLFSIRRKKTLFCFQLWALLHKNGVTKFMCAIS